MIGRQLPFFSLIVPFWLIWAFVGFRGMLEVWPAVLVAGVSFAIPQYLVSNFHGPWLVDIVAAIASMVCLGVVPAGLAAETAHDRDAARLVVQATSPRQRARASGRRHLAPGGASRPGLPWIILSVFVFIWGTPQVKAFLDAICASPSWPIPGLDQLVQKVPPVVAEPHAEAAVFSFNMLSATGTGILLVGPRRRRHPRLRAGRAGPDVRADAST